MAGVFAAPLGIFMTGGTEIMLAFIDDAVLLLPLFAFLPKLIRAMKAPFATERSRLSPSLKNFEMMGLVTKIKSGKNVEVHLTGLGEMFV